MATKIKISIAGRKYPVTVEGGEEVVIREIEKDINNKINEYIRTYEYKDKLDIITLVLLNCSYELHSKLHSGQEQKLIEEISKIENSIDKILHSP